MSDSIIYKGRSYPIINIQTVTELAALGYPRTSESLTLRGFDAQGGFRIPKSGRYGCAFRVARTGEWSFCFMVKGSDHDPLPMREAAR